MKLLCTIAFLALSVCGLLAQEVLTNDSIVKLVKGGMSDEIILNMVKTQPAKFELGVDGVLALKHEGVSEKIINAMVLRGQEIGLAQSVDPAGTVKIPAKTPVKLNVNQALSSGTARPGETIKLLVAEDVVIDGKVIIVKGAAATGRVTDVRKKSFPNYNGKLEFSVDSVQAVDGQNITIEGRISEDGGGANFGQIGKDVGFAKGYTFTAVVENEKLIKPGKVSDLAVAPVVPANPSAVAATSGSPGAEKTKLPRATAEPGDANDPEIGKLCVALGSSNSREVFKALGLLETKYPTSEAALNRTKELLTDGRTDIKRKAARVLGAVKAEVNEADLKNISTLLDSGVVDEIVDGLKALRGLQAQSTVAKIIPLLQHANAGVKRDACRTLAIIASKNSIPSIEPLLQDPDKAVVKDAQDAIDKLQIK